jgi:hypothetical protein
MPRLGDIVRLDAPLQVVIWVWLLLGSFVLMSAAPVAIRRYYFHKHAAERIVDDVERAR